MIELPVCGTVPAGVLTDEIAAKLAWPLLGAFLERCPSTQSKVSPARSTTTSAGSASCRSCGAFADWDDARFYDEAAATLEEPVRRAHVPQIRLELAEPLPTLEIAGRGLTIIACVGGAPLGAIAIVGTDGMVRAQRIRVAVNLAAGFELVRAAVREGIVGRPLDDGFPLRDRLAQAARTRSDTRTGPCELALGRRRPYEVGGSASRRAELLPGAARELAEAAAAVGEPFQLDGDGAPRRSRYVPELVEAVSLPTARAGTNALESEGETADVYRRRFFESLFAEGDDPWRYTTPYEQVKYAQSLALLPKARFRRALEMACAEGHFTARLTPRVDLLVAADISRVALDRARERVNGASNVQFVHLDLAKDPLPGGFDLVVCSEVLYYMGDLGDLAGGRAGEDRQWLRPRRLPPHGSRRTSSSTSPRAPVWTGIFPTEAERSARCLRAPATWSSSAS